MLQPSYFTQAYLDSMWIKALDFCSKKDNRVKHQKVIIKDIHVSTKTHFWGWRTLRNPSTLFAKLPSTAVLIVSQDVEDNKRTASEILFQLPSHHNYQVEVACRLFQPNMSLWSMSNSSEFMMVDDPLKVSLNQSYTIYIYLKRSYYQAKSSYKHSASYTVSLFHRAFPFS